MHHFRKKICAFIASLVISSITTGIISLLALKAWYPFPYEKISEGQRIFELTMAVNLIIGPAITFVTFTPKKTRREIFFDICITVTIQALALAYGLWTMWNARPIYTIFEYDRFRVIHQSELPQNLYTRTPFARRPHLFEGPSLLALRPMENQEKLEMTISAINGFPLSLQTTLWKSYKSERSTILKEARPVSDLLARFPDKYFYIKKSLDNTGKPIEMLAYLPLTARDKEFWTVVIENQNADIVIYLPIDSF
ncbi:hypothetical protein EII20_11620 [Comamonadaceae bacterium OH2545_COT-014]|nr:hypothetical protein EII20_11620 [Comamonadaceae bacterium OH2545_COT-014]